MSLAPAMIRRRRWHEPFHWTGGPKGTSMAAVAPSSSNPVLDDLEGRGLVHDTTDRERLAARLAEPPVTVYCGFDPTADSLHVGHLLGVITLRRLQLAGHRPLALLGGATGLIGDPSGRSTERPLLDEETLQGNVAAMEAQIGRLLEADDRPGPAVLVDNATWTRDLRLPDFLRDVGRHVTVNAMLAKESVRARLEGPEGLSFTEFSYMLIQAHDYLWLHEHHGCHLQVGGSDQWGNITAGIDLIRRRTGHQVDGLTWPLLTRADGTKFGKSEGGNVWLDSRRTSPYAFYQHWIQADDADVRRLLLQLTLLELSEVDAVVTAHGAAPERREGQRRLAFEVTAIVHGAAEAVAAQAASQILFGTGPEPAPEGAYLALERELPTTVVHRSDVLEGLDLVHILAESGLSSSRSDARRNILQGAVYVNDERVADDKSRLSSADLRHERWILLRRGRRHHHLLRVDPR
jgi:tyrosyl-tRNA synthetase